MLKCCWGIFLILDEILRQRRRQQGGDSKDVRFQLDLIALQLGSLQNILQLKIIPSYSKLCLVTPLPSLMNICSLQGGRSGKEMTSHLVNVSRQLGWLRSEMFESFKNCAANLHQLCPLPTKHPCQLQKSQTPPNTNTDTGKYKYRYEYRQIQIQTCTNFGHFPPNILANCKNIKLPPNIQHLLQQCQFLSQSQS